MIAPRLRWTIATIAGAALFVAGGMWISKAEADSRPEVRSSPVPKPAIDPALLIAPKAKPTATPAPEPAGYVVKRVLDIPGPMRPGDWHWDDAGVPDGPVVITVDIKAQTISVFRDGYEIGAAVVLYGAEDKPTPLGVFPISQKKVKHVSNLYGAPMPYMQRLTNDGVAIHASELGPNLATHGCIGVPLAFAKKLFAATKLGDKVIVTNGEVLDVGRPITAA